MHQEGRVWMKRAAVALAILSATMGCGPGVTFVFDHGGDADRAKIQESELDGHPAYTVEVHRAEELLSFTFLQEAPSGDLDGEAYWTFPEHLNGSFRNGDSETMPMTSGWLLGEGVKEGKDVYFRFEGRFDDWGSITGQGRFHRVWLLDEADPTGGGGSCTTLSTGVCSQLVDGDPAAFREHCENQSGNAEARYDTGPCGFLGSFQCYGAEGTSMGKRVEIDLFFPGDFCERFPNIDLMHNCENNLDGRGVGTNCM
jgi:hypothetical protein